MNKTEFNKIITDELLPIFNKSILTQCDIQKVFAVKAKIPTELHTDILYDDVNIRSNILKLSIQYLIKSHLPTKNIKPYTVRFEDYEMYIFTELNKGIKGKEKRYLAYYVNDSYITNKKTPRDKSFADTIYNMAIEYNEPKILVGIVGYYHDFEEIKSADLSPLKEYGRFSHIDLEFFNVFNLQNGIKFHGENKKYKYYVSNTNVKSCPPPILKPIGIKYTNTNDDVINGDIVKVKLSGKRECIRQITCGRDKNGNVDKSLIFDPNGQVGRFVDILKGKVEKISLLQRP